MVKNIFSNKQKNTKVLLITVMSALLAVSFGKLARSQSPSQNSAVLGTSTSAAIASPTFNVNIPTFFNDVVTFAKDAAIPNIVKTITAGTGLSVNNSSGNVQITNSGVVSLNGKSGALSLTAGPGIEIGTDSQAGNLTVTNLDPASSQYIFKSIAVTGQSTLTAAGNSDIFSFRPDTGLSITTDSLNKEITFSADGSALNISGWTDTGKHVVLTDIGDLVGIGTATPGATLDVSGTENVTGKVTLDNSLGITGNANLLGNLQIGGNSVFGSKSSDLITFFAHLADGTTIAPATDLGANLGSINARFNNLFATHLNSESGLTTSGQATFIYAPADTTFSESTLYLNAGGSVVNGTLLGLGVAGYQKAGFDAEGDLTLGYSGVVSAPINNYPLSIYNHGTTEVAHVDTSGNLVTAGGVNIAGDADISGSLSLSTLTSSGSLSISPTSDLSVSLADGSQFTVNTNKLTVDGTSGYVGIGTSSTQAALDVAAVQNIDALAISSSGTKVLGLSATTGGAIINVLPSNQTGLIANGGFETDLTGWSGSQRYSLDDEFSDTLPATLATGGITNPTPILGNEMVANGDMETGNPPTGWLVKGSPATYEQSSVDKNSGTYSVHIASPTTDNGMYQVVSSTNGAWYYSTGYFKVVAGTARWTQPYYDKTTTSSSWTSLFGTYRATDTSKSSQIYVQGTNGEFYADDVSIKPLTLSSLFSTVSVATSTDHTVQADVTVTSGTQAGVVLNMDSSTTPTKFVIGYIDGTKAYLEKNVNGTYTTVIAGTAITYVAGQTLKVIQNGTSYSLFYNGTQVGTTQTISDVPTTNIHGVFSTYASNSFANFSVKGGINGTLATDGVNTRTVTDTLGYMTMSLGVLNFANGFSSYTNPALWENGVIARSAGKTFISGVIIPTNSTTFRTGLSTTIGGAVREGINVNYNNIAFLSNSGNVNTSVGTLDYSSSTPFAVILRNTGSYLFEKVNNVWTLLFQSNGSETGPVYYAYINNHSMINSQGDYFRVPSSTFLPTPLAYDTFTRADGALGTSETTGPDSQTTPGLSWTGSTWTISSNKAINTPNLGNEINGDVGFDNAGYWTVGTNVTVSGGQVNFSSTPSGQGFSKNDVTTANTWYRFTFNVTGGCYLLTGSSMGGYACTNNPFGGISSYRAAGANIGMTASGTMTGTVDNFSIKPLTTSELFSSVTTSTADVVADVNIANNPSYNQAGLVLNLDSTSNPQNYILAYHDGTYAHLEKIVNGTPTSLILSGATFSANATLRVTKDGTKYRLYYNNALVGTEQTITDAGIINNTKHGLFSTYSGNQLDNFTLFPRGTGNEYAQLSPVDLTVTRDNTTVYPGSTASAKLVAGATDNDFTELVTGAGAVNYTLSAYAYTNGSPVTSSDLNLYYGSGVLPTIFAPTTNSGWYKLTGTFTATTSAQPIGVRVKAGKTVYVDNISSAPTSGANTTLYVANSGTGMAGLDVQSTSVFHSGLAGNQALIIKGSVGQSENLTEWRDSSDNTLAFVSPTGLFNAGKGAATFVKSGTISDADFTNPVNGMIAVDATDGRIYFRAGGVWSFVAKTGGFQIPFSEAQGLQPGDLLIPYVESLMSDGAVHGLYKKLDSSVTEALFAPLSARLDMLEKQYATNSSSLSQSQFSSLNVLGLSTLNNAGISGTLSVGSLTVDRNGINAIGNIDIYPAASFNNNAVEIDASGTLKLNTGVLSGNDNFRGSEILNAGQTQIVISRKWTLAPVSVVAKARFQTTTWITDVTKNGFIIHTASGSVKDQFIDWEAVW